MALRQPFNALFDPGRRLPNAILMRTDIGCISSKEHSMKHALLYGSTRVLSLLPFAQALTKTPASPTLMTAAALVNTPFVRRIAPGLSAVATVGIAAVAIVKGLKRKKAEGKRGEDLARSSAT
jgi:hypothetical protein